ncbi:MAG: EamA family transporter [Spirochaetes bacterium]|nr:EamA family transporter [Spirochaetota bacterium]
MSILLLIISAVLAAGGQLSLKKSALHSGISGQNIVFYFLNLIKNPYAWLGVFFYGTSFMVYMIALKRVKLSYARSFSALSYVLVIILSILIFKDNVNIITIIGIGFIAIGILFVGLGV